ncbi:hypothetical protein J4H86_03295 [Spiractinospora alimapuensis]|uniref:hypothetical protein n=1 Tax=Spiractinospora alimapuensis TaxID=2820884 RepID=UPI001F471D0F|nr:hypothetical protein [Spiractinospora alimapuensis]QVQ52860.1 hypothetical protein J4H86_03295 [Spiractinospora alimapuensis]
MSRTGWWIVGGVGAGLIALWLIPTWVTVLVVLGVLAVPVVGYAMLDPSQRRRLRQAGRRGQLRG